MEFDIIKNLLTPIFPKLNRSIIKLNGERSLFLDTKGIIWIGTTSGFIKYDTITKKEYFTPTKSYNKPSIFSEDSDNNYWIATFGDGLIKLNSKTGKIKSIRMMLMIKLPLRKIILIACITIKHRISFGLGLMLVA